MEEILAGLDECLCVSQGEKRPQSSLDDQGEETGG
jgi:hypothetical protein